MGKAQGFFNRHQQQNVWAMTGVNHLRRTQPFN